MTIVTLNKDNFKSEVEESDLPVIIDFWADWCMPCRMMAPVFEELSKDYDGKMKFARLDTDHDPELASRYNIQGIPALVITKAGTEVDRIVGFGPKDTIKSKIDDILGRA